MFSVFIGTVYVVLVYADCLFYSKWSITTFLSQFGGLENISLCNVLRIDEDREDDEIEIINQSPYFDDKQLTGSHPDVKLSNLKLVFLTSHLQPCDAGITATLKVHYRKRLVRHVLAEMATVLSKRVDVMDAIGWLWLAW